MIPTRSRTTGTEQVADQGLRTPLQFVKGVGPQRGKLLAKLGLETVEDALFHLPARHEDRTRLTAFRSLTPGEALTATGVVAGVSPPPRGRPRVPLQVLLRDSTGFLKAVWFNQSYLERLFKRGQRLIVHGKVQRYGPGPLQMQVKDYEIVEEGEDETLHAGRLVPVYGLTQGLTQRPMRSLMKRLVDRYAAMLEEPLPETLMTRRGLQPLALALTAGHFPRTEADLEAARRRLIFDDFFLLQLGLAIRRQREGRQRGLSMQPPGALWRRLLGSLPYRLTRAQERVWGEIRGDMAAPYPMNRLLQGDVGSGKTVVAALAILTAIECGYQAAFMAPTEILAEQHLMTLRSLLDPLDVRVALLTNATRGKARETLLTDTAGGEIGCVVGTHALVQEGVRFKRLGLVVVDEQHRFGVAQRATLRAKGERPDVLVMTATPIPRTLALTLYGDLDVSVLDELPPGRKPVVTVARPEAQRRRIYEFLAGQIAAGRQVYVVCPLVEESEASDLRAATEMADRLRREIFPDRAVGLLHGRMSFAEKDRVMREFKDGRLDILVSTTVIEVGIDVPNAAVMLIEHAERFGLSQLHQLRGRVGRGPWKSYCILLSGASSDDAKARIAAMTESNDGFRIAEVDLSVRGPGEFFGTRQSGLPEFRVADLLRDGPMLEEARQDALALVGRDPQLLQPEHRALRAALLRRWRGKLDLASVG
ncbi:MAG TPA: ATP-dependent DNA helicase RecG [Methylomirabilota bacterium]|jgi:ATP-dependent DNA helicase RecG|nr:ATP-dependent DNA helicase RecG [Methylomirabilota bacterium]